MINWLTTLTTEKRAPLLFVIFLITAAAATGILSLRTDPSLENLIASYEGGDNFAEEFRAEFGDSSRSMVLLIEAQNGNLMRPDVLAYVHNVSTRLSDFDFVETLVSLTDTPIPRRVEVDPNAIDYGGLDDLEALDDENLDDDNFDDLDDGPDPALIDALVSLVEADPERFPGGFQPLATGLSLELAAEPIVKREEGEEAEITDAQVEALEDALEQNEMFTGRLISADRTVMITVMSLAEGDSRQMRHRAEQLVALLDEIEPPENTNVSLGGLPYMRTVIVNNIRNDQIFLVPLTLVVCMILLAIFLRWAAAVVLPIIAVAITALIVVGMMGHAGESLNILNNIIPTLLIIIGISDSIHLIGRYREELDEARNSENSNEDTDLDTTGPGKRTVRTMAIACLLTSVTTAVGLVSLVVSKITMLRHFGVTAGLGVMVAYGVTITFLPAVLTWVKAPGRQAASSQKLESAIEKLTRGLLARPWAVLIATTLLLTGAAFAASSLKVDHAILDQFKEGDSVYQVTRTLEDKLDGVRPLEISLRTSDASTFDDPEQLARLDEVLEWANGQDEVLSVMSPMHLMRSSLALLSKDETAKTEAFRSEAQVLALYQIFDATEQGRNTLGAWLNSDRTHLRLQIKVRDVGAQATMRLSEAIDERLAEALPDSVSVGMTGEAYDGSVGMDAVVTDLLYSLLLAVVIIFFLLTALFRSLRLGLLSIPPNLIPLALTMAYMVWRGIPLNAATVIIFSVSLGLAVDGTIHVLARYREETRERGLSAMDALILAARGTGRAIVVSGLTLMAGFSVLLFSNFVPVQRFGELIAVTVGCTLFATLIVQPALLYVAGGDRKQNESNSSSGA